MNDAGSQGELIRRLRMEADAAYARVRESVFDREEPGADPTDRTPEQKKLVAELEAAEAALTRARQAGS